MAEALSCQELVELVTDGIEGALDEEQLRRFEDHLLECGACREYVEQMRETIRVLGRVTPETMSPAAESALLDAFRDWHAG